MMQKLTIISMFCMLLNSCVSIPSSNERALQSFPSKPALTTYTKNPVIQKVNSDFLVTEELILNSTMLTDYYKRIEKWKQKNKVL